DRAPHRHLRGNRDLSEWTAPMLASHTTHMLDVHAFKAQELRALSPGALAEMAEQMLQHIGEQSKQIDRKRLGVASGTRPLFA
ncbi:MAG TPA: hypothetical protein VES36_02535, partial [Candidatus Limnocylindrales bacterium]|nr:hypothetical protein [Candidatus Limnocylindrales bacterium]